MNKKYLPSALILYLNYFIHGVGCSILGQAVIKEALAASWGVQVMAITAISAALGLGRLIALPFAGPLSDKLGRRISTAIGSSSYAIYLIGLCLLYTSMRGCNVTMPDKVEAAKYMDELSPAAQIIGALNTIVNEHGKLTGHITDGEGFVHRSLIHIW